MLMRPLMASLLTLKARRLGFQMVAKAPIVSSLPPAAQQAVSKAINGVYTPLVKFIIDKASQLTGRPLIVGISGGQGSGKTTTTKVLQSMIASNTPRRCVGISLDDFYVSKEDRARRASTTGIEALRTRGPPGTHQTERLIKLRSLIVQVLTDLHDPNRIGQPLLLPHFDKASDTTIEDEEVPGLGAGDVFLLEGWCVGAPPPLSDEPVDSMNDLDANLKFRNFVDDELRGIYSKIWDQLDIHVHLQVPNWQCVLKWRQDQEDELCRRVGGQGINVEEFCRGYERITRRMLKSCPAQADAVIFLDEDHHISGCRIGRSDATNKS